MVPHKSLSGTVVTTYNLCLLLGTEAQFRRHWIVDNVRLWQPFTSSRNHCRFVTF